MTLNPLTHVTEPSPYPPPHCLALLGWAKAFRHPCSFAVHPNKPHCLKLSTVLYQSLQLSGSLNLTLVFCRVRTPRSRPCTTAKIFGA